MKPSIYNFFISYENSCFCFNAMSFSFFKISKEKEDVVKHIIENPDNFKEKLPAFISKLKMNHFILENELNELEIISQKRNERIYEKKYKLIIMPTLGCNFKCWYCVQDHKNEIMSADTIELIKKNIQYNIIEERVKYLALDWFGGEPFTCFYDVIEPLSVYSMKICEEYGVSFINTSTTNGYLLNREIIKKLNQYKFKHFQITLDGERNFHNRIRHSKIDSSFDIIIDNINLLAKLIDDVQVTLRINYDDKNLCSLEIVNQLEELIPITNRKNIRVHFRKVWQSNISIETICLISKINECLRELGFGVESLSSPMFIPCYVNKKYQITVAPNGGIYKCTAMQNYTTDSYGRIGDDGQIIWKSPTFYNNYLSYSSINNAYCSSCKYLPLCMGKCHKRFENENFVPPIATCKRTPVINYENDILKYCLCQS